MLKMVHPEINASGQVVDKDVFNQIWAPRGWRLMDPATAYANDALGKFVRSADHLDKDEARALVATRGGEYPDENATGAVAIEAYKATFDGMVPAPATTAETAAGVQVKLYDPSQHPVDANDDGDEGVLAYLDSADDDERVRVLSLEEAGKGRVTILNWSPADETDSAPADNAGQE